MSKRTAVWLVCLTLAALVLLVDWFVPPLVAAATAYSVVVLYTLRSPSKKDPWIFALFCAGLTLAGVFFSWDQRLWEMWPYVLANRGVALFAIGATGLCVMLFRGAQMELAKLNRSLESRVAQQTEAAQSRAVELEKSNEGLQQEIIRREQVESDLLDTQALYASLVDELPIPILRKNVEGEFVFANDAFYGWVGLTRAEVQGKSDADLFPAELAEKYRRDDLAVMRSGELMVDVEENHRDGQTTYVYVIKTAVRDASDQIIGTQALFWDVTAQRVAEKRLRDSEALYHSLVDHLPICLCRKDLDGKYTFVNKAFNQFFGMRSSDVVGKTDYDFFPVELADKYSEGDKEVVETGEALIDVEKIELQGAGERLIDVIKTPVMSASGKVVGVQILFRDVTEEIRMEAALKNSEQRLQSILDNSTTVIYLKDYQGRYILVNRRFEELFHVSAANVIGKTDYDVFPSDLADRFRANDEQVQRTGETLQCEESAPHADGLHTYVSIKFPLKNPNGKIYAVAGMSTDITDRKQAEEQLRRYAEELQESNHELEQFAYITSHDLQEPLRSISFFSDSLRATYGDQLPEQAQKDLNFIHDAALRMRSLVQDLLSLSRTGRTEMKTETVDLAECVRAARTSLHQRVAETDARISVDDLPTLPGDRGLLTQLFQNLIGNALKFSGGQTPIVEVTAQQGEKCWTIGVRDHGIGLKPTYAEQIFAPFQKLHANSEYEGTGIGLAICRKVVQRHGGRIWVESSPGEGAHFLFELPETCENGSDAGEDPTANEHEPTTDDTAGGRQPGRSGNDAPRPATSGA